MKKRGFYGFFYIPTPPPPTISLEAPLNSPSAKVRKQKLVEASLDSEKAVAPHSSTLAWKIPGRGSLMGCRLWGRTESETTEAN